MTEQLSTNTQPSNRRRVGRAAEAIALVIAVALSAFATTWLIGEAASKWWGDRNAPWIVGRAAGITSYLLLIALVATGLLLAHPHRTRWRLPSPAMRIRLHVAMATFTFVFVVLHVVVLATDSYAGVGFTGALVPMGAEYRPVAVTLGVIGLYSGLIAGITALLARGIASRIWWPLHKIAVVSLVLVWMHSVLAGSDTPALLALYLVTGGLVVALAVSRYVARTPADLAGELAEANPVPRIELAGKK
jgi:hypothetical protein